MSWDEVVGAISAVTALLNALAWPLVVLFVVLRFAPQLIGLIGSGRDVTIKALGIEATFTQSVAEAAVALSAAEAQRTAESAENLGDGASEILDQGTATSSAPSPESVANSVATWVPTPQAQRDLQGATVLWVDDNPDNNRYEREAFQAIGIRFELSTSTEDALRQLGRRRFDAVISDMGRGDERDAGYRLLEQLRKSDRSTPFIIYAGSGAVRDREAALARGAQGSTNSPRELMALVIQAIQGAQTR